MLLSQPNKKRLGKEVVLAADELLCDFILKHVKFAAIIGIAIAFVGLSFFLEKIDVQTLLVIFTLFISGQIIVLWLLFNFYTSQQYLRFQKIWHRLVFTMIVIADIFSLALSPALPPPRFQT